MSRCFDRFDLAALAAQGGVDIIEFAMVSQSLVG